VDAEIRYKNYFEGYQKIAKKILSPHPEIYELFKQRLFEKNYRGAHYYFTRIYLKEDWEDKLTPEEKKIETEFYWLFVN